MASDLQRIAQGLLECLDEVPQIVAHFQRTATRLRQQASWIADLGSGNPYARQAALLLDDAAKRCDEAAYRASLAQAKATVWAQTTVGAGTAGGGAASTSPVGGTVSKASRSRPRTLSPAEVAAKGRRLPVRDQSPGHRAKTRGVWTDASGQDHDLVSGADEFTRQAHEHAVRQRLAGDRHARGAFAITTHVEVKFAMLMRERGLRSECIVINKEPCPGDDGCDALLPEFLPEGASLTVYELGGFQKTYYGKADRQ